MTPTSRPDDAVPADPATMGYADALVELEAILVELDDDRVDIDVLADRVERAAALIEECRSRVNGARVRVTQIVAGLDPDDD